MSYHAMSHACNHHCVMFFKFISSFFERSERHIFSGEPPKGELLVIVIRLRRGHAAVAWYIFSEWAFRTFHDFYFLQVVHIL